jgi:ABC-type branched-subunit amino acid transport system ATPase component
VLTLNNVTKAFYGSRAVDNFSLKVHDKEIVGLMGPNGAGKTTVLNLISGAYFLDDGSIYLDGERIDRLRPWEIARRGIARTFQVTRVFRGLTVLENMLVPAMACASGTSPPQNELLARALNLLELVGLTQLRHEPAGNLSGGQQRLLELVRALMMNQQLLLLDEPSVGLHPTLRATMHNVIKSTKNSAFLIVSHDIPFLMRLCGRIVVMSVGSNLAEGTPEEVRKNETVIEAYLGR